MSRVAFLLAAGSLLLAVARPAGGQTWARSYDGPAGEGVLALGEDADGGLLVAAWTDSFGTATADAWLLALDANGLVVDESLVTESAAGGADGAAIAADGGALVVGRHVVDVLMKQDAWAVRVERDGSVRWGRRLAWVGFGRTFLADAAEAVGGGWFVMGTSGMNEFPPQNAWIVKLDDAGAVIWQQEDGSGAADTPHGIAATADGGLVMAGSTTFAGNEDLLIVKYDSRIDITWQYRFGGAGGDRAEDIVAVSSGGYAVAGVTESFTPSGRAPWLLRFDDSGNLLWHQVFGDIEWGDLQAIVETADGALLALGRIAEADLPITDLWAVKVAADDGRVIWQRAYRGSSGDRADALVELSDGSLLLGGTWGLPQEALWLLRTDAEGWLPDCGLVRDTSLPRSSPPLPRQLGPLVPQVARAGDLANAFGVASGGATVSTPCLSGCAPLLCEAILASPGPACDERRFRLELVVSGGEGALRVDWDVDGDGLPEASGNPVEILLPPGPQEVAAVASDECAFPGPQDCMLAQPVDVPFDPAPPGEVSERGAGAPPLLVEDGGLRVVFEEEASALAFDLHVGGIGDWYAPRPPGATVCHRLDAVSGGDGTASLAVDLPAGSWLLVSASDDCFEGPAGADSFGAERSTAPDWEPCGPLP